MSDPNSGGPIPDFIPMTAALVAPGAGLGDVVELRKLNPDSPFLIVLSQVQQHQIEGHGLLPVKAFSVTLRQLARTIRDLISEDEAREAAR